MFFDKELWVVGLVAFLILSLSSGLSIFFNKQEQNYSQNLVEYSTSQQPDAEVLNSTLWGTYQGSGVFIHESMRFSRLMVVLGSKGEFIMKAEDYSLSNLKNDQLQYEGSYPFLNIDIEGVYEVVSETEIKLNLAKSSVSFEHEDLILDSQNSRRLKDAIQTMGIDLNRIVAGNQTALVDYKLSSRGVDFKRKNGSEIILDFQGRKL